MRDMHERHVCHRGHVYQAQPSVNACSTQATSGLAPDGRMVVNRAADEASNYKRWGANGADKPLKRGPLRN